MIVFLLRELYVLHPELQNDRLEGKKQKQFETRFIQVVAELASYCNTATVPFVLCYLKLNKDDLCESLLRDFSCCYEFTD